MKKVWASLITAFKKNGEIDYLAMENHIKLMDKYPFEGFLIGGSIGEGMLLSFDELSSLITLARSISKKPIMIAAIDFNFERVLEKTKHDCDFLLITPPIYFKPNKENVLEFFNKIAAKTDKKIWLYNNPTRVCFSMTSEIYDELYKIPNICGLKECDDNLFDKIKHNYPKWEIYTGNDSSYEAADFKLISTICNVIPNLMFEYDDINFKKAVQNFYLLPNPVAAKIILSKLGRMELKFRAPFYFKEESQFESVDFEFFIKNAKLAFE